MKPFYRETGIHGDGKSAEVALRCEALYRQLFRSCVVGYGIRGRWTDRGIQRSSETAPVSRLAIPPQPTARTLIPIDHAARSNSSSENSTLRDERPAIACAITTRYGYGMMAYQSLIDNNRLSEQSENPLSGVLAI